MKLVSIPANPVPENAVTGTLLTRDGIALRYARWAPPAGRKGTVCLLQGRAEFIEKYFETVMDLRARGFAVATLDWRGQGLSERLLPDRHKGYVRSFADYDADLETFMHEIVLPDCPPPFFAIGHSMGGAILLRAARQGHRWFDRIVLSAPMIALRGKRRAGAARTTARLLRLLGFGTSYVPGGDRVAVGSRPFVGNILTSDPVRYARNAAVLEAEPELALAAPTVAWADAAFRAMSDFAQHAYPAEIRQPILIIAAGKDDVVSTQAIEDFALRLRAGSHLIVGGSEHEILMEQDHYRAQFWAAFDAFVPGTPLFGNQ
jgi:lysophospholipase